MARKYRKKPVVVEAVQWDGQNHRGMWDFLTGKANEYMSDEDDTFIIDHSRGRGGLVIKTLEGYMFANIGDYIIKGVNGEFYPCKPDIFEQTYTEEPDNGPARTDRGPILVPYDEFTAGLKRQFEREGRRRFVRLDPSDTEHWLAGYAWWLQIQLAKASGYWVEVPDELWNELLEAEDRRASQRGAGAEGEDRRDHHREGGDQ